MRSIEYPEVGDTYVNRGSCYEITEIKGSEITAESRCSIIGLNFEDIVWHNDVWVDKSDLPSPKVGDTLFLSSKPLEIFEVFNNEVKARNTEGFQLVIDPNLLQQCAGGWRVK